MPQCFYIDAAVTGVGHRAKVAKRNSTQFTAASEWGEPLTCGGAGDW